MLGYLNQIYLPAFSFSGISPSELIRRVVFNWYNTEIMPDSGEDTSKSRHKCFANGYIGDFDTDENGKERKITRYTDKSLTAMDILQTRLVDYFGGDLHVKMAAAPEDPQSRFFTSHAMTNSHSLASVSRPAVEI